jgi:hypothetical protein
MQNFLVKKLDILFCCCEVDVIIMNNVTCYKICTEHYQN